MSLNVYRPGGGGGSFSTLTGDPTDNAALAAALGDLPSTPSPLTSGRIPVAGAGNTLVDGLAYVPGMLTFNETRTVNIVANSFSLYNNAFSATFDSFRFRIGSLISEFTTSGLGVNTGGGSPARQLHVRDTANPQVRLEGSGGAYVDGEVTSTGLDLISSLVSASFTFGQINTTGSYAQAMGQNNTASSWGQAMGQGNTAGYRGQAMGGSNTTGSGAQAMGYSNTAGDYAQAMGIGNTAGHYAQAMGHGMVAGNYEGVYGSVAVAEIWRNVYWGGGKTHATPAADLQLNSTGGSGTDISATDIWLSGGRPTGAGIGGSSGLRTAPPGATGTTLQALKDRLEADTHGVVWVHPVDTAPTVGKANQIGLFSDAGVLKLILPDNTVATIDYT